MTIGISHYQPIVAAGGDVGLCPVTNHVHTMSCYGVMFRRCLTQLISCYKKGGQAQ